ncbi:MAG: hypothetical protein OQK12_10030 [Motiliproteus sp.]|nr:hypothetical protein [Motiliproteus sp.]MCW9053276.1 hypothetical protein [Motiliproteus sp.]
MQHKNSPKSRSWLGSTVFIFTTLYLQLSLADLASLISAAGLLFLGGGILVSMLLIDIPAQFGQTKLLQSAEASDNPERKVEKAQALGTFVKAAQVIAGFIVAKYAFLEWMV